MAETAGEERESVVMTLDQLRTITPNAQVSHSRYLGETPLEWAQRMIDKFSPALAGDVSRGVYTDDAEFFLDDLCPLVANFAPIATIKED